MKRTTTTGKSFQEITEESLENHHPTETPNLLVIPEVACAFGIDTHLSQLAKSLITRNQPETKLFSGIKYQTIKNSRSAPKAHRKGQE